ncbi:metalloprotease TldD [Photorhabdus laumondii subsp. laumondii]|uniref:TldD protein, suppresses the inhibitory activity of the carbon storage regulator (CSRA) n=2 Tax=Photorhabdus laumondii subsp. laumondii TaxID=141679 RepID=Q7N039_PHOLL|nr:MULTISPECIES: metalloprotease TldD [Photorhabdus]AWK43643.1 metalloprotease TldD [Photorhabdus laumondii subsp. laumondii]AXG44325.1 metalloprotease TldD [Photorhabdus laumondii subsp. laumondii]AXG48954.1 metalloprotease TldD [Photorhabdus laumondii subsp. laumondii]KTL59897.1 protease TldD [Photorhabdus laumondii subsp. laumondii]MCC8385280.1 metalloprotease TldD [Photorhabdus laumondii]
MSLTSVSEHLLAANKLSHQDLFSVLGQLAERRLDYADLYFQSSYHESWVLEDRIIKDGSYNIDQGVGVRAISGEKTGFAYADQITLNALQQSAQAARSIVHENGNGKVHTFGEVTYSQLYAAIDPLQSFSREEKIALLQRVDQVARAEDPRVQEVNASLTGIYERVLVAATDGTLAADIRPLVRLSVTVLVEDNGKREHGTSGGGGRYGYEYFLEVASGQIRAEQFAREAVRMALVNLSAVAAPAGTMPVVLGAGWPGVLLHEAVGHGLEGDFNRRGTSVFSGQIGEKVASELCTVVDDATIKGRRGSLAIDDEGVPGQYNVLIENGILKGYMQDKMNARLMGVAPTGNGRRESYAHLPMPRMTNTYLLAGHSTPEEIISSVENGLYAPNFGGGQVDITSGKFVFSTSEAYLIENGKITKPVKGATLIGSGIEAMQQISMVGNDLDLDKGVGVCGKEGQSVPVGVGQPTLKLDNLTVGGTA